MGRLIETRFGGVALEGMHNYSGIHANTVTLAWVGGRGGGSAIIYIFRFFKGRDITVCFRGAGKDGLTSPTVCIKLKGRGLKVKMTNLHVDLFADEVS